MLNQKLEKNGKRVNLEVMMIVIQMNNKNINKKIKEKVGKIEVRVVKTKEKIKKMKMMMIMMKKKMKKRKKQILNKKNLIKSKIKIQTKNKKNKIKKQKNYNKNLNQKNKFNYYQDKNYVNNVKMLFLKMLIYGGIIVKVNGMDSM